MALWCSSCHVILFAVTLILWQLHKVYVDADINGSKLFKKKVVYDVSEVMRRNTIHNGTEILPKDFYVLDADTSTNYYFLANDDAFDDVCWWEKENNLKCSSFGIEGISLMFRNNASKSNVLAMKNMRIANTTIVNLLKMDNSCIDSVTILIMDENKCSGITETNEYLIDKLKISSVNHFIKFGIEYNDEFLEQCADDMGPFIESWNLDHTILRIRVSPSNTMLLYERFFEKVHQLIQKNRGLFQKLHPDYTLYIRLENVDWNPTIRQDNYQRYDALMTKYLRAFSVQNDGKEVFIFSPTSKHLKILPNNQFFGQNVSLLYHENKLQVKNTSLQDMRACAHQQRVKMMLSNVERVVVDDQHLHILSPVSCKMSAENGLDNFSLPVNSSLSLILKDEKIESQVEDMIALVRNSPAGVKIKTAYIDAEVLRTTTDNLTKVFNLLKSQNIHVGCFAEYYVDITTTDMAFIAERTIFRCEKVLKLSKNEIIHFLKVGFRNEAQLLTLLGRIHQSKLYFEGLYPDTTFTLAILLHITFNKASPLYPDSFYCEPEVKKLENFYQVLYNFANIHEWSSLVSVTDLDVGVWRLVRADEHFQLGFPVLFRTNAPLTPNEELPMTYPCIQRTLDAKQSHINFSVNRYSGASFQTNLRQERSLSSTELNTTLHVTMNHFPSVELIVGSRDDFKLVEKVITANAQNAHVWHDPPTAFLYIEVPLAEALSLPQEIGSVLSSKQSGVHLSNWESLPDEQLIKWKGFQQVSTPNFGITVQKCGHEMNSKLIRLKSLPFMQHVRYIVCNVAQVFPSNLNRKWMEDFLGTIFYTRSYMEHFLSTQKHTGNKVEVMFRLNYNCVKTNQMDLFLRFLNDVNQHSAAYKIRYFLVHAFETESSSANCSHSWWRLDSYADLSNISTYVNTEDEFAGREARIPFQPRSDPVPNSDDSSAAYYIAIVSIVAILILAASAIWLHHQREKKRVLTRAEITQFYDGNNETNEHKDYLDFGNSKFPKAYEIPRNNIDTEEIIGSGQFGVVHRGSLSKRTEVAIKIPRSDCDKEQFKSTLSELKILCHIGQHVNIVSFLGACTKDIANGNLHIVIEYCKNGCLLKFLRQNRETNTKDSLSLFEMHGFSLQIASGMEFIAAKRVIHGDLAARNILLTEEMTCKIADFGLSRRLYEMNEYKKTSKEPLPWRWMAPESLQDMEFTTKSDVWSYGVTLWEIFSLGMVPYPGLNWSANYVTELKNGMRMEKAPHATGNIHAKILDCWNINSEARPAFTELKEFFIGMRNEEYIITDQH